MEQKNIYIVFSSTPYKIGKFIRRFTGEEYNHVSIALDEGLREMYSFARRHFRTPLYGGFVKESLSRHHVFGQATQIQVCKLTVTGEQYDALAARLRAMYEDRERYLYNHFSVLSTPFRKLIKVKDCYICVEFAAEILQQLGLAADPEKYYSVGDLQKILSEQVVYTGPVPETDTYDEEYFAPKPVPPLRPCAFSERFCPDWANKIRIPKDADFFSSGSGRGER